jgi:bifunctional non-homologous end joining protein LigD
MIAVSNSDRVVFPEVGITKGDVVAYYERMAPRALVHLLDRPLSIRRYPKGLAAAGFYQKNVPNHYPESIQRVSVARNAEAAGSDTQDAALTVYPLVRSPEHLVFLANQGAIECHVPNARVPELHKPDRLVIDLDPPAGAFGLVRTAAQHMRAALAELGLTSVPIATGSKGYHIVAPIEPSIDADTLALAARKFATLQAAKHPDLFTTVYRTTLRGPRVFIDWLRNNPLATVIAPYSLRATPRATVATPIAWDELKTTDPDTFTLTDIERLLDRADPLAQLAAAASDPQRFVADVEAAFDQSGLPLPPFDRFRS